MFFLNFIERLKFRLRDQSGKINLGGSGDDDQSRDDLNALDNAAMQQAFEDSFGRKADADEFGAGGGKKPDAFEDFNPDDDDFSGKLDKAGGQKPEPTRRQIDPEKFVNFYLQKTGVLGKNQTFKDLSRMLDRAKEFEASDTRLNTFLSTLALHPDFAKVLAETKLEGGKVAIRKPPKAVQKLGEDGLAEMKETLTYIFEEMGIPVGKKQDAVTPEMIQGLVSREVLKTRYPAFDKLRPMMLALADMNNVPVEDRSKPEILDKLYKMSRQMLSRGNNRGGSGGDVARNQPDFLAGNGDFSGFGAGADDLSSFSGGRSHNRGTSNIIDQINSGRFPKDLAGQQKLFEQARMADGLPGQLGDNDFEFDMSGFQF